jgi:hypothetical protein
MAAQIHHNYGKKLLRQIVGDRFISSGDAVRVRYKGCSASIDGVINNCCAIEIESRVAKQVRGALLDLLEHPLPKKLLILVPAHMYNPEATVEHCKYILGKYKKEGQITKVILLEGIGNNPKESVDKEKIKDALKELGCL